MITAAFTGRLREIEHLETFHEAQLSIESSRSRVGVSLDGELLVMTPPLRFRIRPGALRVVIPHPRRPLADASRHEHTDA